MDQSRRAVESYWRSRLIDGATSDEDKVAPVYKLEEICDLLRSSHVSIVKELSEFLLKRLDHKSPIVKQKALRLIKYAVVKSGTEFRREMQRNSAAVRQLFHYKGKPDPLKGDALNKAVRDTAHEALTAIFSADDNKTTQADDLNKRIQGFGNTNFEKPSDDKKTLLSEVVGIGSATIMHGLNSLTQAQSSKKNETGNYKGPNLGRSLSRETGYRDSYDQEKYHNGVQSSSQLSKNESAGPWGQDFKINQTEATNGDGSSSYGGNKTLEERLLETIVTPGGVRLQPTRDVLQVFLTEASKVDAVALSYALESKLLSPSWQVRMKAICVLEAILRKKSDMPFSILASYFSEKRDVVTRCSESPQASLREKSKKVLSLLDGQQASNGMDHPGNSIKAEATLVQVPDLIDTSAFDDSDIADGRNMLGDQQVPPLPNSSTATIVDLFGDSLEPLGTGLSTSESKNDDDPFADVSFHANIDKEPIADISSRTDVSGPGAHDVSVAANGNLTVPFDIFGDNFEIPQQEEHHGKNVDDIMAGLSINENTSMSQQGGTFPGSIFSEPTLNYDHEVPMKDFNGVIGFQPDEMNVNSTFSVGSMTYHVPPGLAFNPALSAQQLNYGAMGSFFTQQQLLAAMANFQQLGNLQYQNTGFIHPTETKGGLNAPPLPDIFNPIISTQTSSSTMNNSKKEETRAFDFISDHLAAARDPKRVV